MILPTGSSATATIRQPLSSDVHARAFLNDGGQSITEPHT